MHLTESLTRGQPESFAFDVVDIEGELPASLDGVLFRNGAGTMQVGSDPVCFLDGHALLCGLDLAGGKAFLRAVHPETGVRREELAAGRLTRRRVFTNLTGWRRNFLNLRVGSGVAHDSYVWGGAVHASDLGDHYTLALPSLATEGKRSWDAVVEPGERLAPMPRDDPATKTLVAYALKPKPGGDLLRFVEVDEQFGRVARTPPVPLRGFVHDCAFSERWYVTVQNPAMPRALAALGGLAPLWWSFAWRDEGPTLVLVPRGREGAPVTVTLPSTLRTVFHVLNAYDDGDEVVVDIAGYEGPVHFDFVMPAARGKAVRPIPTNRVARVRARPRDGSATVSVFEGVSGEAPEVAPAVHGRRYTSAWFTSLPSSGHDEPYAYVLSRALAHLEVERGALTTWDAGDGHQLSPPAFAPDTTSSDPEAGWVLAWDLDLARETSDVVVLRAHDVAAGPIARVKLGVYLPAVSHVRFAPGLRVRG